MSVLSFIARKSRIVKQHKTKKQVTRTTIKQKRYPRFMIIFSFMSIYKNLSIRQETVENWTSLHLMNKNFPVCPDMLGHSVETVLARGFEACPIGESYMRNTC